MADTVLTDPATGLTAAEVADRVARGLTNTVPEAPTRTVSQIIRGNVFTPVNAVVGILAAYAHKLRTGQGQLTAPPDNQRPGRRGGQIPPLALFAATVGLVMNVLV